MDYVEKLSQLAQLLSVPNSEAGISPYLAHSSQPDQVKLFVDGNLDKRRDKLHRQLEFVVPVFDSFDDLVAQYVEGSVLAAYDTGASDGCRMLDWLLDECNPTAVQTDYISCQRARYSVEEAARLDRLAYIRFQEWYSLAEGFVPQFGCDDSLRAYLNPTRCWAQFFTDALLEETAEPPVNVLFFAVGGAIGTAVFELEGQTLINELAEFSPCTLDEWTALTQLSSRTELAQFSADLVEIGLLSLG